jgi:hypothetical protein
MSEVQKKIDDKELFAMPVRRFHTSKKEVEDSLRRYAAAVPAKDRAAGHYGRWKGATVSPTVINRMFGSFQAACDSLGIETHSKKPIYTDDDLLGLFEELWRWRQHPPTIGDIKKYRETRNRFPTSATLVNRFGNYKRFVKTFSDYKLGIIEKRDVLKLGPEGNLRKPFSTKGRFEVLTRAKYRCEICGASQADGAKLHVDHIVPVSKGGGNEPENLRCLCEPCNLGRSDRHFE